MIRRLMICLLTLSLTALVAAADDPKPDQPEPPVELKKKKRPDAPDDKPAPKAKDPAPKKDGEPKKDGDPKDDPPAPSEDDKQILERINKNLKEAEERLKKKDTGDATRQTQKDIVTDLEALIKQSQQQAQNQPQGGGGSSKNPKDQQASGKSSRSKRTPSRGNDRQPNERPMDSSKSQLGGAGSKMQGDNVDKLADLHKDVWGNLPETLRMAMDVYAREQFMSKYSELLKQYYSTIAERKRRGEEEK
jgi:pyruvate/2-oxoglutarate dehydrogenase complex dihydrolipoamide acyltransferase (E2) component